jgi:hypothetical protein
VSATSPDQQCTACALHRVRKTAPSSLRSARDDDLFSRFVYQLVTAGHSRSKNGVASLAYDPAVHVGAPHSEALRLSERTCRMDCWVKLGNDEIETIVMNLFPQHARRMRVRCCFQ